MRQQPAAEINWQTLCKRNFDDDLSMLRALGKFALRSPVARMEKANVEARQRGRAGIREALRRLGG
jgi:hypothetical protein